MSAVFESNPFLFCREIRTRTLAHFKRATESVSTKERGSGSISDDRTDHYSISL
jgi:hypothetical protein